VLFDEPELSLSMEWQKKLLTDVLRSNQIRLLLAVTHSPFVFDNDLDHYAEDMNKYVAYLSKDRRLVNNPPVI
jgi:predicted ATP-binding protein involved in virulence